MSSYVELLLDRYKPKGLLIDANLLLLYLVGTFDRSLIGDGKYNKLSKYTVEDYDLLLRLKNVFPRAVTTAHVLTEVSNLTSDLPSLTKTSCLKEFGLIFTGMDELALSSYDLATRPEFPYLGLTDAGLAHVCEDFLILTDDARFVAALNEAGMDALNFSHLRGHLMESVTPL